MKDVGYDGPVCSGVLTTVGAAPACQSPPKPTLIICALPWRWGGGVWGQPGPIRRSDVYWCVTVAWSVEVIQDLVAVRMQSPQLYPWPEQRLAGQPPTLLWSRAAIGARRPLALTA